MGQRRIQMSVHIVMTQKIYIKLQTEMYVCVWMGRIMLFFSLTKTGLKFHNYTQMQMTEYICNYYFKYITLFYSEENVNKQCKKPRSIRNYFECCDIPFTVYKHQLLKHPTDQHCYSDE